MPKTLHGKRLTKKEHKAWRGAYKGAQRGGADEPGAVATAQIKKMRAKKGLRKKV